MLPPLRALPTLLATMTLATALGSCGDDGDSEPDGPAASDKRSLLPEGGEAPVRKIEDLEDAARKAACRLAATPVGSRDHTADLNERVRYKTDPPAAGRHFQQAAPDGAYDEAPADTAVVHAFEHGRVGLWINPELAARRRAQLRALAEEDSAQLLIVPRADTPYEVAASAWNRDPEPFGTGRLLTCETLSDRSFDALRAFRDEHRGRGPEPIP